MIKAAIFDMDGTLLDSMNMWEDLIRQALVTAGIKDIEKRTKQFLSLTVDQAVEVFRDEFGIETTSEEFIEQQDAYLSHYYREVVQLKPGSLELLKTLKNAGLKLCLAKHSHKAYVDDVLNRFDMAKYFDFVLTADVMHCSKEDPKFFETCFDLLQVYPHNCAVFEDSLKAASFAKKMGTFICGIFEPYWGKEPQAQLKKLADIYVNDLSHVKFVDGDLVAI